MPKVKLTSSFLKEAVAAVGIVGVQELAGHAKLNTTKIYCHPGHLDLEKAIERLAITTSTSIK